MRIWKEEPRDTGISWILSKILTLFVLIRYPSITSKYRWFIRFRYLAKLVQLRYFWRDYIVRKPYKIIEFKGEFQHELIYVLPFAYWHCKNGTLKKTISTEFTKELYFFSTDHEERNVVRGYKGNFTPEIPNAPHDVKLDRSKWLKVPLREHYKNDKYVYQKPSLIIANKFNTEWEQSPVSFFDLELLEEMINILSANYQIIYNRPPGEKISGDNSEVLELGDYEWLSKHHPEVMNMADLYDQNAADVDNYNHMQLLVYANCDRFVSIHGGTATLASYFGGTNVIYSKRGHEHYFKEFTNVFPKLADTKIIHCKDREEVIPAIKANFV